MEFTHEASRYEPLPEKPTISQRQLIPTSQEQRRVTRITQKILEHNRFATKYEFIVFRSESNQVMHTKNGKIYIPTGLIHIAKTDDHLAFLLAHEIAHWKNGDIKDNQAKIPISPGEMQDAECDADRKAWDTLPTPTDRDQVRTWLDALKKDLGRNEMCEL